VAAVAAALVVCGLTAPSAQPPGKGKNVLALYWYARQYPSNVQFERGLQRALEAASVDGAEYFSEFLEIDRFPPEEHAHVFREFLRQKYAQVRIDVIVAEAMEPFQFLLADRSLFPGVPIVYHVLAPSATRQERVPGAVGIFGVGAYRKTVELVRTLHPDTEQLLIITSLPNRRGKERERTVREELAPFDGQLTIRYLTDRPTDVILREISQAPPRSIVIYGRHSQDLVGSVLDPIEAVTLFSRSANVPIYGVTTTYLGHGLVGGYLLDLETSGKQAGELALRILGGARLEDLPVVTPAVLTPEFDARQLQRWNIDPSQLPPGAEIKFGTPTTWMQYRWYVVAAISIVTLQTLLIAHLLAQHARRRRAEAAGRASEDSLRASYERTRQLAGHLITAQETTRRRIALDLHDDVCQELAGLSVAVGQMRHRSGRLQDDGTQNLLILLQRRTQDLVDSVRRLSHDLHPSTLTHVGLAAALESHCIEIEQRFDVQVSFSTDSDLRHVPEDAALCLFRISQEAMRNAATHGEARRIRVWLVAKNNSVDLTVADDGVGFDVDAIRRRGEGLGLVSMEERAHLAGGQFAIDSNPGRGAVVRVRLPIQPGPDAAEAADVVVDVASDGITEPPRQASGDPT
jgi:signal transduction histidine kinase